MGLIGINIVMFVGQHLIPDFTDRLSALSIAIDRGEWWRLFSAMFLHHPTVIFHIIFNMYVLYAYGPHVEQAFGHARFLVLYLICGFGASAVSYAFHGCFSDSLGASGAIFGVVGLLLVYVYNRRQSSFVRQFLRTLLFFVGLNLLIGFAIPRIDNLAHIGGLVSGVALGLGFDQKGSMKRSAIAIQLATAVAVAGAAVALVVYRSSTLDCGPPFFLG